MTATDSNTQTSGLGFVGQSVKRVEDDRLLRGKGNYVADLAPEGVLHAHFVRSTVAHALISRIDVTAARRAPGVVKIITGAEMKELTNPFPPFMMLPNMYTPLYWALSDDKVRLVGDPVAIIVAESRYLAEDAAQLVEVDYEPLTPVASISDALSPSKDQLWEKADGNVLFDSVDTFGDIDSVFAGADRIITERFSCQRQSNQPMETRGSVVEVDQQTGHLTITNATQSSHVLRWVIAGLTEKKSTTESLKSFLTNKERRTNLLEGLKAFVDEHGETLKKSDNAGAVTQLKKDKSFPLHLNRISANLAGKADFPTVLAQDIGGGFGAKGSVAREDIALAVAAIETGRSVKWIEDRVENLIDGGQAREEDMTVSIALDNDGTFRGLKVDLVMDQGAYPGFPIGPAFITQVMKVMFPGSYKWDAFQLNTKIVCTNKGKYIAYRGPWANETWVRERIIDIAARALRRSPTDLRLQNMFGEADMPNEMITGPTLDETMSTRKCLERLITEMDIPSFEAEQEAAAADGRALGIGFACFHEAAPGPPNYVDSINPGTDVVADEKARTVVQADGSVKLYTPQMPHGQSHETTYAQIAADELGVNIDDIELIWGNTDKTNFSFIGTGGSRGGPIGGGSIKFGTRELRKLIAEKAADMLEASVGDIEIIAGNIHVAGVPSRGLSFAEVAQAQVGENAPDTAEAFEATVNYKGKGDGGWSCAAHACVVEVDLDTGLVNIPRYLVVEDCGPIINPAIVDGQVRGGIAQGVGAVLYEGMSYDEDANIQTTTYMDYLIPTAMEIPEIDIIHLETLTPGENDFRGVGEGGMIGAPAALTNAIENALSSRGARVTDQYLPPTTILELAGIIEPDPKPKK